VKKMAAMAAWLRHLAAQACRISISG